MEEAIKDTLLCIFRNKFYLGEHKIEYTFSNKVQLCCENFNEGLRV